ncbi:hypothetical protein [Roseivirga sp.]|uniref:hypothetical protein n=1 Tax=Roseivirga sp. TaxID=1964215 RepID=UPI002B274573|nr:hypothetical protein [Roseivirga sp.]
MSTTPQTIPKITITLQVDTVKLSSVDPKGKQGPIDDACKVLDNNSAAPGSNNGKGSIERFQSNAYLGGQVKWIVKPLVADSGFTVALKSISVDTILGAKTKNVKSGKTSITKTISDKKFLQGDIQEYTFTFQMKDADGNKTTYSVDPKIKLNPPPRT